MRITAKVDYAVRACVELAARSAAGDEGLLRGEVIGDRQGIPTKYLESILSELRRAGLVSSQRGPDGGYRLAQAADAITIADVIRAVEGPLADVRGAPPEDLDYPGVAAPLEQVWIANRASIRRVLERMTLASIANDQLPADVLELLESPGAWERR
ncbi:MAG: RrF2 family transcriptional regulator [Actinomycetes bacterium]